MPLIKIEHGLLENENFYLNSPLTDFLGDGSWSRTQEIFVLKSGTVKRKFPYKGDFMIEVKKEINSFIKGSINEFFIEDSSGLRVGIKEVEGESNIQYWRIIYCDGFIQTYVSLDGDIWENKGGSVVIFEGDMFQGFKVSGETNLVIEDYKIYSSPYLKLQNFRPGTTAKLYDYNDTLISERNFDNNYECNIFLDKNIRGYIKVFLAENLLFTSSSTDFTHGDVFLFSNENIQLIHNDKILDYTITDINEYDESFIIKNAGSEPVLDIYIEVINKNTNIIEISFDKQDYKPVLCIERLEAEEEKEFYLRIIRDSNLSGFSIRQFEIDIH